MTSERDLDDRERARRILDGDSDAFRSLFDQYFPRLYRFALARMSDDRDEVRDVVQQTFCRAIERLDSYRGEAALYTWFCQICSHLITDRHRARSHGGKRDLRIDDSPQVQAILDALTSNDLERPDVALWKRDVGRVVQTTLDRLPERYAEVLEWKYVQDLPVTEIAARLAIGPKAAESLLTRARQAFRDAIGTLMLAEDALSPPGPH